jgi:hypothetical protein
VRLPRHIALCLPLLLPCAAQADDLGPAQAQVLQQQLKDWLAGLLGPGTTAPDLPLQIAGEGDHYRVTWPIPGLDDPGSGAAVTASVRPLDGGRWAIDAIRLPQTASFTVTPRDPGDMVTGGPLKATLAVGRQDSHAEIDPALGSPSTLHIDLGDLAVTTDRAKEHQEQRIARYAAESSLKPARDGRLDAVAATTIEGWETAMRTEGGAALAIGTQAVHATGEVDGVSREKAVRLISAMNGFFRALPADAVGAHAMGDLPPPARAALRALIEAVPDVLSAVRLEETVDGLQVELAGMGGFALRRLLLGFGGEAPDGDLHARFEVGLDGLETPSLPPNMAAYLPHHLELRPSVSGIRTEDLSKLALDATDDSTGGDRLAPDIAAIFAHGPVNVALEALSFDLGPANIEGVGKLVVAAPDSWHGEAKLSVTGLDELMVQARKDPELKQALPVLMMLRGLAKPDGSRLVWNIASDGTAVTVNGIDLPGLAGDAPKAKRPDGGQGQPRKR